MFASRILKNFFVISKEHPTIIMMICGGQAKCCPEPDLPLEMYKHVSVCLLEGGGHVAMRYRGQSQRMDVAHEVGTAWYPPMQDRAIEGTWILRWF